MADRTATVTPASLKTFMPDAAMLADAQVATAISAANIIINDNLLGSLPDATLDMIELYLAAHYTARTMSRLTQNDKIGDSQVAWQGNPGMEPDKGPLGSTSYGEEAMVLDKTGRLRSLGRSRIVSGTAVPDRVNTSFDFFGITGGSR